MTGQGLSRQYDGATPNATDELYDRYTAISELVREPVLGEQERDFKGEFSDIEEDLFKLWHRDMAEWIEQRYRDEFQKWEQGNREKPPCTCGNPRCPLLQGKVPYQLRRRSTTLGDDEEKPMDALKNYLKEHPDALVIDEALTELREIRSDVARRMTDLWRDIRRVLDEEDALDHVDPSGAIDPSGALDAPGGPNR